MTSPVQGWQSSVKKVLEQSGPPGFREAIANGASTNVQEKHPALSPVDQRGPVFKAQVALAALMSGRLPAEVAAEFDVHPDEVKAWSAQLRDGAPSLFAGSAATIPRALANNPYGPDYAGQSLAERVKTAAEASAESGRTIGAIVMHIAAREAGNKGPEITLVEDMAHHLLGRLRGSDYCAAHSASSIIIYLSLLHTIDDLHSIARRMHMSGAHYLDNSGYPEFVLSAPGAAFYPLDGDTAASLHEFAAARTLFASENEAAKRSA